ncbi:kinase-like protein [Rhizophagus irregularis]|uniref:Kinase-like protein n=1 Tax=Rhizophagus irregularis TaxID=588596 RepID=A0A2N0QCX2_9GLOM|nr:kinase-like protein [Rhizophagus irregularis]
MSNLKKNSSENTQSSNTSSASSISSSLIRDLGKLNLTEERLKRYADEADTLVSRRENELRTKAKSLREKAISKTLSNIKRSMEVDLCFVLDCSGSMGPHIAAAKDCILQVSNYVKHTNPSIKLRVGFCGYRDHYNGLNRLQIFDFNDQYDQFTQYMQNVLPISNDDLPEDVLGGLNAAITQLNWQNSTRVLLHIGDYPPHGRRFTSLEDDKYPDGDPNGLTAESVLEKMQSKNILYFFGKITDYTDTMLEIFRSIIGEFPVFDLVGGDPIVLVDKLIKATSSSITIAVSLTSMIGSNSRDSIYTLQQRKLDMDPNEPNWDILPLQKGTLLWYCIPETLDNLKNSKYFNKSNLFSKSFSFKIASQPFSAGVEKYAYFARDVKSKPAKEMVMKEYLKVGERNNPLEKYLEAVEVSTVAHFLSMKFNLIAERKNISKVNFLNVKLLRCSSIDVRTRYYAIEPRLNAEYKRFNVNTGVITKLRDTLEAFAHFTYEYTEGYLVVCDLQGIELIDEFLLTDPAIHCIDPLRFGGTNFGEKGISELFLANHRCNDICKKLKLRNV